MAQQLSAVVGAQVEAGISALEIPGVIKDSMYWDVTPALAPDGRSFKMVFMVAITIPVSGTEDYVLEAEPLMDVPAPQDVVTTHVQVLYGRAQAKADAVQRQMNAPSNGAGKLSPGGLHLP